MQYLDPVFLFGVHGKRSWETDDYNDILSKEDHIDGVQI